jgi:hypothetical protein
MCCKNLNKVYGLNLFLWCPSMTLMLLEHIRHTQCAPADRTRRSRLPNNPKAPSQSFRQRNHCFMNHWLNLTLTVLTYNFSLYDFFYYYWEPPIRICNSFGLLFNQLYGEDPYLRAIFQTPPSRDYKRSVFRILPHENNAVCGIDKHTVYLS